jgi:hypothetical protein
LHDTIKIPNLQRNLANLDLTSPSATIRVKHKASQFNVVTDKNKVKQVKNSKDESLIEITDGEGSEKDISNFTQEE